MTKQIQSRLIVGRADKVRKITKNLAANFGIDLHKPSPDNFIITPDKNHLTIDQVRELKKHIFQKPLKQPYKFVILEQAETLTIEAQNALLKILEEPPESAILVLEAQEKGKLLPTITSRCTQITSKDTEIEPFEFSLLDQNLNDSMVKIAEVKNPKKWLDNQMRELHLLLLKNQSNKESVQNIVKLTEFCAQTKKMIDANVNPKFALANLFLSINLASI